MDKKVILEKVKSLNEKSKRRFFINLMMLFKQEFHSLSLDGPYKIILDSNVIMRLEEINNKIFNEGNLAILTFFDYYKNQNNYVADFVIIPTVFYEFYRQQNSTSFSESWERFKRIKKLIEDVLDIRVKFSLSSNIEYSEKIIKAIENDMVVIKNFLKNINKYSDFELVRSYENRLPCTSFLNQNNKTIEIPPISAAKYLIEQMKFKMSYFNFHYIQECLAEHLAYAIENNPRNNLEIARKYKGEYPYKNIVFIGSKDELRGLADIEILSFCDIRKQFMMQANDNYYPASISLTLDENLFKAIPKETQVSSSVMTGGEDTQDSQAKWDCFLENTKRMDDSKKRQEQCCKTQIEYIEDLERSSN